jgi:DNA polymerase-4
VVEVAPDEVADFLHPLPVEAMWGIGRPTAGKLHRLGLTTVGDLASAPADLLRRAFGPHAGRLLTELAWGRDPRRVSPSARERSVGSQETFRADTEDPATIRRELLRMAARTASRTRKAGLLGRTVTISIRFADFTTISRSATLSSPTDVTGEIHAEAVRLYEQLTGRGQPGAGGRAVRRVGVRLESLVPRERGWQQPELTAPEYGWHEAERAVDRAVSRFGPAAVQRASLAAGAAGRGFGHGEADVEQPPVTRG